MKKDKIFHINSTKGEFWIVEESNCHIRDFYYQITKNRCCRLSR